MKHNPDHEPVLSFRSSLQNGMQDFVINFQQPSIATDVLTEFILILSSYQEEGVRLFPIVFIGENLEDILKVTRGMDPLFVGQGPQTRESVRRAFKRFAPLTEGREWAAYVVLEESKMSYGIFRSSQSPLAPTAFEYLRQTTNPNLQMIGLSRLGGSFIEVRSARGEYKYVNLTGDYEEAKNPPKLIHDFMKVVTRDAPPQLLPHLRSFYYRVGVDILHGNHGTLLAVVPYDQQVPGTFRDGIILQDRIDVAKTISNVLQTDDPEAFQRLNAWSQLLRRMTRMDGITLIDTSGAIVGYNCFIRHPNPEINSGLLAFGGARRRAFDVLRSHLGAHIAGVMYKSQDGVVEMESV